MEQQIGLNMNYQNNKLYYQSDLKQMLSTMATVVDNPKTEEIKVNNITLTIYIVNVEYNIVNYILKQFYIKNIIYIHLLF